MAFSVCALQEDRHLALHNRVGDARRQQPFADFRRSGDVKLRSRRVERGNATQRRNATLSEFAIAEKFSVSLKQRLVTWLMSHFGLLTRQASKLLLKTSVLGRAFFFYLIGPVLEVVRREYPDFSLDVYLQTKKNGQ